MGWQDALLRNVDDTEVIQLCEQLVAFPSFPGAEGDCARAMARCLEDDVGLRTDLQEVEPGRPNVIGCIKGHGSPNFMFNGHLDIDPLPDDYDRPLFQTWVEDGTLWGTGLGNMKAGLASMIGATLALIRSGIKLQGDVTVALVIGELSGGIGTQHLVSHNSVPELAIVPEPTGCRVRTVHAGCLQVAIKVASHRTLEEEPVGRRAIPMAMAVLDALETMTWSCDPHPLVPGLPRLSVGGIASGALGQRTASEQEGGDQCYLLIDVRTAPGQRYDQVVADLHRTLDPLFDGMECTYELGLPPVPYELFGANALYQPPLDLPVDSPLAVSCAKWHRSIAGEDCEVGFDDPGSYACADTGWLFSAGCECLNYGPAAAVPHHDQVSLEKLAVTTRVMALVAAEFCRSP